MGNHGDDYSDLFVDASLYPQLAAFRSVLSSVSIVAAVDELRDAQTIERCDQTLAHCLTEYRRLLGDPNLEYKSVLSVEVGDFSVIRFFILHPVCST